MSVLRRSIFIPFFFALLVSGALAFAFFWFSEQQELLDPLWRVVGSLGIMVLLGTAAFYFSVSRPMRKIVHEMKALLTGKMYHRIFTNKTNELGVLAHFFNEVTRNLESISGSVESHKRIVKELSNAQEIQQMLIPKNAPPIKGLEVTAKTRPASEIGGDTFDFYKKGERTLLYVGDSTGHGIPAGIVMVMVDALLETFIQMETNLSQMVIQLNTYLKPHLKPTMFMTMILLEWIPANKKLRWVGGGHEYILHVHTNKSNVEAIPAGGLAVGMLADNSKLVKEQELQLEENDFIVLYSDGIVEAKNVTGETYGLERLSTFLKGRASSEVNTRQLFEAIAVDVGRFMEGATQLDDMTLIVMKAKESAELKEVSTEWDAK